MIENNMKQNINEEIKKIKHMMGLNEEGNLGVFDNFPPELLEFMEDNYSHMYMHNYDWNEMSNYFRDRGEEFREWRDNKEADEFVKNEAKIITAIRSDLINIRRTKIAKLKLDAYEELLVSLLGNHITGEALTKFQEDVLLDPNATPASIQRGFEQARYIIDQYGNIDQRKIEISTVFPGGEINYPTFERFVEEYPKYLSTFKIWEGLLNEYHKHDMKNLNGFRIYEGHYKKLRSLYDFLTSNKKKI